MNNFINVRFESVNHYKTINDIKHNIRTANILSNYKAQTEEEKKQQWRSWKDKVISYTEENIFKTVKKLRKEHNQRHYNRTKRNLQNSQASLINGIISFSEKSCHDLGVKYTKEEYEKTIKETIEELAKHLKTEVLYIAYHYQEKTPHAQFHLKNFNEKGFAIWNNHTKSKEQGSIYQDIGFKHLKALGMKRGLKKNITEAKHQTTEQYYKKQIRSLKEEARTEVKKLKAIRKELSKMENIEQIQKKELYQEITDLQKEFRRLQEETDIDKIKEERDQLLEYVEQLEAHIGEIQAEEHKENQLEEELKEKTIEMTIPVPMTGTVLKRL